MRFTPQQALSSSESESPAAVAHKSSFSEKRTTLIQQKQKQTATSSHNCLDSAKQNDVVVPSSSVLLSSEVNISDGGGGSGGGRVSDFLSERATKIAFHSPFADKSAAFVSPTPPTADFFTSPHRPIAMVASTGGHRPVLHKSHSVGFGVDSTVVCPSASASATSATSGHPPPLMHQHSASEAVSRHGSVAQPARSSTERLAAAVAAMPPPPASATPTQRSVSSSSPLTGDASVHHQHRPVGLSRVLASNHLDHQGSFGFSVPEKPGFRRSESLHQDGYSSVDLSSVTQPSTSEALGAVGGARGRPGTQAPGKWRSSSSSSRRSASRNQPLSRSNSRNALQTTFSTTVSAQGQGGRDRLHSAGSVDSEAGFPGTHCTRASVARTDSLPSDVVADFGEETNTIPFLAAEPLSSNIVASKTDRTTFRSRKRSHNNDDSVFGSSDSCDLISDALLCGGGGGGGDKVPRSTTTTGDEDMQSVFAEEEEDRDVQGRVEMDSIEVSQARSHSPSHTRVLHRCCRRRSHRSTSEPSTPNPDTSSYHDDNDNDREEERIGDDAEDQEGVRGKVRVEDVSEDEAEEEENRRSQSHTPPGSPRPSKSRRMDMGSFDPYQIFEVQHLPCIIFTVKVLRGRNITNGMFQDLVDTPDPYVKLRIKTAPEGRQRTRTISNNANPVWNETFTFLLGFSENNVLELTLMEENPFVDQESGTIYFNVHDRMREFGKWQSEVFNFNGVSTIDVAFHMEWDQNPTLRYSLCLSDQEKEFMRKRKQKVYQALQSLLGEDGPQSLDETPTIAVIGSGGGFRAMTGYSGVFKALADTGLLDCATYACGLSGSSWYLSTLYSDERWPDRMTPGDLQRELMTNIDKSLVRLLGPKSLYRYVRSVVSKRKCGQPVSFTDFFGHMVGETLLKGRMDCRLTDQREKLESASVPMPLYTCVHVKKDVPAKSFQEWVEFSPYEIGMPKYGTFMDSKYFGSKFYMGKLVKAYDELPLHFLQGIWGSAFCILFKRLLEDNRNLDPAEMIRREIEMREDLGTHLEETQDNENDSSDISDDEDDEEGGDETDETDDEWSNNITPATTTGRGGGRRKSSTSMVPKTVSSSASSSELSSSNNASDGDSSDSEVVRPPASFLVNRQDSSEGFDDVDMAPQPALLPSSPSSPSSLSSTASTTSSSLPRAIRKSSSTGGGGGLLSCSPDSQCKKGVRFSCQVDQFEKEKAELERCQQEKTQPQPKPQPRRPLLKRASTIKRGRSRGYWSSMLKTVFESQSFEVLNTRAGRAAVIHNFMRGLNLQQTYPLSPFTPLNQRVQEGDEFDGNFDMHPTHIKHIYMVDAGLTFNSPYPLVLRPQRGIDVILSFDFSGRDSDSTPPFKELLLAEKWARLNRLPFPPIDPTVVDREGLKELYVFRDPQDPDCPVVLHFSLLNINFRRFKAPGVPRETKEELDFADFDIFDDPTAPFSTFNFTYTHQNYQRLSQLTEFNTLLGVEQVKEVLAQVVRSKRGTSPRTTPIHNTRDFRLLRMKSVQERRELKKFLKRMESRTSMSGAGGGGGNSSSSSSSSSSSPSFYSVSSGGLLKTPSTPRFSAGGGGGDRTPATPFFTPTSLETSRRERNPFVFSYKSSSSSSSSSSSKDGANNSFFSSSNSSNGAGTQRVSAAAPLSPRKVSSSSSSSSVFARSPRKRGGDGGGGGGGGLERGRSSSGGSSQEFVSTSSTLLPVPPSPSSTTDSYDDVFDHRSAARTSTPTSPNPTPTTSLLTSSCPSHPERQTSGNARQHRHHHHPHSSSQQQQKQRPFRLQSFSTQSVDVDDSEENDEEDEFEDAAEALTRAGEVVTDPRLAKMYYEGAKERRRLFRRQSTISTLNSITESISLDSSQDPPRWSSANSQASSSAGPIDVDDLTQFEGIADYDNGYDNDNDNDNKSQAIHNAKKKNSINVDVVDDDNINKDDDDDDEEEEEEGDEHWYDGSECGEHRGSVIDLKLKGQNGS